MARSPGPGKCVHCLRTVEQRSWDHLFPRSWYPDTTPADLEKWSFPSCLDCNHAFGELEKDLLIRFGLCLNPDNPASSGIVARAFRSLGIEVGKELPEKEKAHREAKKQQIIRQLMVAKDVPTRSVLQGFAPNQNVPLGKQVAIGIPADSLHFFIGKVAKGVYFLDRQQFVEPPYNIMIIPKGEPAGESIEKLLAVSKVTYERPPGLVIHRGIPVDEPNASILKIKIWDQLEMYAIVSDEIPPTSQTKGVGKKGASF